MGGPRRSSQAGHQLTFDLAGDPGFGADDFLVSGSNADAFRLIDSWPDWMAPTLVLAGPPGSGKSHLGAIWAKRAKSVVVQARDAFEPDVLSRYDAILLEDCDRACRPEAALFHLLNLMKESGGFVVMTARRNPDLWGLQTADLLSRLRLSPLATIGSPDTGLIRAVIVKLFADRQIRIEEDIVTYAALHLDQSLEAVTRFVSAVDEAALSAGRRITKPLAAATIGILRDERSYGPM